MILVKGKELRIVELDHRGDIEPKLRVYIMTVKGHLLSFLNGKLGRWDLSLYEQFVCLQGENISIINQGEYR